ncbi:MAG TPA: hypothetical protein DEQ32_04220 [Gammaproteobacteria bacterium]|nr:hypothetical protein [Gammaproteobacteria bacterium]
MQVRVRFFREVNLKVDAVGKLCEVIVKLFRTEWSISDKNTQNQTKQEKAWSVSHDLLPIRGSPGSLNTRKMRALLRYRLIPY